MFPNWCFLGPTVGLRLVPFVIGAGKRAGVREVEVESLYLRLHQEVEFVQT